MASLIKVSPGGDNKLLSPDPSFLKRPSVVPSIDRLSSSCYGKVQGSFLGSLVDRYWCALINNAFKIGENGRDTQQSPRQSQSAHPKLSTVSLKRSSSSNVPQVNESVSKPQPPFKRLAVLSTGLKSNSNQAFARSSLTKGKTPGSTAGSTRHDKMGNYLLWMRNTYLW